MFAVCPFSRSDYFRETEIVLVCCADSTWFWAWPNMNSSLVWCILPDPFPPWSHQIGLFLWSYITCLAELAPVVLKVGAGSGLGWVYKAVLLISIHVLSLILGDSNIPCIKLHIWDNHMVLKMDNNQSINQSINQSLSQSINRPTNQSITVSLDRSQSYNVAKIKNWLPDKAPFWKTSISRCLELGSFGGASVQIGEFLEQNNCIHVILG